MDGNCPPDHSETPEKTSNSDQTVVSDMHRPDRIGALVLTFAVIALYIGVANFLNWLSLASLPLGTIDALPIMVIDVAILNLYVIRQRKRAQN